MKEIIRNSYLDKLINRKENGVEDNHIIKLDLEERKNKKYLNPDILDEYIRSLIIDKEMYYVILDEIQKVEDFEAVLNGFLHISNLDVYVTGSNSKFLSSDVITEFRGRDDEVKVYPLSFEEFLGAYNGNKEEAWNEYLTYGGMPYVLTKKTDEEKSIYLNNLFETTYLKDIIERNNIQRVDILNNLVNILSSSVGSLTNPTKLVNTFISNQVKDVNAHTVASYIDYLIDSFLITKSRDMMLKAKNIFLHHQSIIFLI